MCSTLKCFFNLSLLPHWKTHYRVMCSMLNCFINLRSCLTEKTRCRLCARCSTDSSTSAHVSLRKKKLSCARCSTVASASAGTVQAIKAWLIHSHQVCWDRIKGKAVPLEAWSGPDDSRKLMFIDFLATAQDGGKVVSLTHRPLLPPEYTTGTHFC
jgi:hypothetical protein